MATALAVRDPRENTALISTTDLRLPAPIDKAALRSYLTVLEDPEALELQNRLAKAYDTACRALIGENDVQKEGGREFKKKSAWKKLARYFSISTTVINREERYLIDVSTGESVFVASCTVRAFAPWGQAADALGACATDEETGRRSITIADAIATAETRASNRATSNLIAMGEVSAEETTREEREQVAHAGMDEMTLDEARAVKFPWKNPEKYRDKPLGELSVKMLGTVLEAVEKEIAKVGETPRRLELRRAAQLLIKDHARQTEEAQLAAEDARLAAEEAAAAGSGGSVPMPPPGKVQDALDFEPKPVAAAPSVAALSQRVTALLEHEKFTDDERAILRGRLEKAATLTALQELLADVERTIDAPF